METIYKSWCTKFAPILTPPPTPRLPPTQKKKKFISISKDVRCLELDTMLNKKSNPNQEEHFENKETKQNQKRQIKRKKTKTSLNLWFCLSTIRRGVFIDHPEGLIYQQNLPVFRSWFQAENSPKDPYSSRKPVCSGCVSMICGHILRPFL